MKDMTSKKLQQTLKDAKNELLFHKEETKRWGMVIDKLYEVLDVMGDEFKVTEKKERKKPAKKNWTAKAKVSKTAVESLPQFFQGRGQKKPFKKGFWKDKAIETLGSTERSVTLMELSGIMAAKYGGRQRSIYQTVWDGVRQGWLKKQADGKVVLA